MVACLVECNCDILWEFGNCVSQTSSAESMILNDVNTFQSDTGNLTSWHFFVQQKADVSTLHIYFCIIGLCIEFIKFYLSPYMLQLDIANKSNNSALVYNKHV